MVLLNQAKVDLVARVAGSPILALLIDKEMNVDQISNTNSPSIPVDTSSQDDDLLSPAIAVRLWNTFSTADTRLLSGCQTVFKQTVQSIADTA